MLICSSWVFLLHSSVLISVFFYKWSVPPFNTLMFKCKNKHSLHRASLTFIWVPLGNISLIAQLVKNLPAMQETQVQFLGREDPLEKGQATHSSILGLPLWLSCLRICLQCGRPGFNPWVGMILWRRERLSTPVFWPGEFHGLYSPWGSRVGHDSLSANCLM